MQHFPIFLGLAGRPALVVGGGPVAARKVALLLKAGARVTVVAPRLGPALARLAAAGRIAHRAAPFAPADVAGQALVIAATDRRAVNAAVSRAAQAANLPVNVVDDAALSSFIMPAIVDRAPITVAISSGGAAPVLARLVRARIEAALPTAIGRLAELGARLRPSVRRRLPGPARRRFWESLFEGRIAALVLAGREDEAEHLAARAIDEAARRPVQGEVALVGAGPGDPDLLTLGALRALQGADVIAHDRLVAPEILDLARRDAERIDVGKSCGDGGTSQDRINALLVELARAGKRVVRLKGGDPFVFGRGGEEMQVLAEAGDAGARRSRRHRRDRRHRAGGHPADPPRPCPRRDLRLGPPAQGCALARLGRPRPARPHAGDLYGSRDPRRDRREPGRRAGSTPPCPPPPSRTGRGPTSA